MLIIIIYSFQSFIYLCAYSRAQRPITKNIWTIKERKPTHAHKQKWKQGKSYNLYFIKNAIYAVTPVIFYYR